MSRDLDGRDPAGYGYVTCPICNERIRLTDPCADRRTWTADGGTEIIRAHRACLKEGVERWNRENRPHSSPLAASRRESWSWHTEPPQRLED